MEGTAVERWPRLIAEHRARQIALAAAEAPRALRRSTRQMLWICTAVAGALTVWMARLGIREIDLSPSDGLADSVGLAWGALYAGASIAMLAVADLLVVGLSRPLPPLRRAVVWFAATALTTLVFVVLTLLRMSAERLTYV